MILSRIIISNHVTNVDSFDLFFVDAPRITPSGITLSLAGERVDLKCIVKAKPPPKVIFWRDSEGNRPVPLGSNYEMSTDASSDVRKCFSQISTYWIYPKLIKCLY